MSIFFHKSGKIFAPRNLFGWCLLSSALILFLAAGNAHSSADFVLGPGDVLEINVFQEPELSLTLVVSQDGTIHYPLLNDVSVAGKTAHELAKHISDRLVQEGYLLYASVNIMIVDRKSSTVTLTGAVLEPGTYPLEPDEKLRDYISNHGGINEEEAGPYIVVSHIDGATQTISRRSLFNPRYPEELELNLALKHGDEVLVPNAEMIYVQGAVANPKGFPLTAETTLAEAVGLAGGWTDEAGTELIWQHKAPGGATGTIEAILIGDLEAGNPIGLAPVSPGDIIYVEAFNEFYVGGEVMKPGGYPWKVGLTLTKAVAVAGGLGEISSGKVEIRRKDAPPDAEPERYDLTKIRKNKVPDPEISPGDVITLNHGWLVIPHTLRKIFPVVGTTQVGTLE